MSQLLHILGTEGGIRLVPSSAKPTRTTQGLPTDPAGGLPGLAIDLTGAITHHHQGLPFTAQGRLAAELAAGVPAYFGSGAAPFSATGRLLFSSDPAIASHIARVPFAADGRIREYVEP